MVLALAVAAHAQCSCSVASTDTTLPLGIVPLAGDVSVGVDYGAGQTGGEPWEGVVAATDLQGNSMAFMAMPGHVVQSARVSGVVGAGNGFSASVVVPYVHSAPLYPSDMPGDVARGFVGDVSVGGRWAVEKDGTWLGTGLIASLPTGKVVRGVGVRAGRGAVGATLEGSALQHVGPVVGLAGRVAWTQGLYASPIDDYLVGPQLDTALGTRVWTQEEGPFSVTALAAYVHRGHDRRGADVLDQTGVDVLSVGTGFDWKVWSARSRSVLVSLRGQVPIVQVVGDPWLTENWTLSAGAALAL
jgi:hypothetical protein